MGDRANIVLVDGDACVYLYTYNHGSEIEKIAAEGLRTAIAAGRENDTQCGGRIITQVFLNAHATPTTGAGVSGQPGDGMDHVVVIDFDKGTVDVPGIWTGTFAEFVENS